LARVGERVAGYGIAIAAAVALGGPVAAYVAMAPRTLALAAVAPPVWAAVVFGLAIAVASGVLLLLLSRAWGAMDRGEGGAHVSAAASCSLTASLVTALCSVVPALYGRADLSIVFAVPALATLAMGERRC